MKDLFYTFVKHKKFMDVALWVDNINEFDNYIEISGQWVNQGFIEHWFLNEFLKFKINKNDYSNWEFCKEFSNKCLRYRKLESIT